MECHYAILGIAKDASVAEIKQAYRKAALLYHPDKISNNNTNTNNDNNKMFIKINTAYQILIDPIRREEYDRASINSYDLVSKFFNLIFKLAKDIKFSAPVETPTEKPDAPDPTPTTTPTYKNTPLEVTVIPIYVELKDLYFARVKKVTVKIRQDCIYISKSFYISLLNYKTSYVFLNQGDDTSDLSLELNIKDSPEYKNIHIDQVLCCYDLYIEKEITLYDYYYGINYSFEHVSGEVLNCTKNFRNGSMNHIFKSKGLPYYNEDTKELKRGDLYIYFKFIHISHKHLPLKNPEFNHFIKKHFSS
jgi:DnaJ-class molecular chaperone